MNNIKEIQEELENINKGLGYYSELLNVMDNEMLKSETVSDILCHIQEELSFVMNACERMLNKKEQENE